jgi:hypothetical protein
MKNVLQAFVLVFIIYCSVNAAQAQSLPKAAITINASTTGAGIGFSSSLNRKWSLTAELDYLQLKGQYSFILEKFPIAVNPNTKVGTLFARADYYPFSGKRLSDTLLQRSGLRISAGIALRNNPTYQGQFRLEETFTLGDFQLTDEQRGYVQTMVTTSIIQPFAGIGYDIRMSKYIGIGLDAGVFYHGKPQVDMTATGMLVDIAKNEDQLEKNLSPFRWFPHVGVRFSYYMQKVK